MIIGGTPMRFNYKDYERAFPRQEKPKPRQDPEDSMVEEIEKKPVEEKEVEDGAGTDGKSDTE